MVAVDVVAIAVDDVVVELVVVGFLRIVLVVVVLSVAVLRLFCFWWGGEESSSLPSYFVNFGVWALCDCCWCGCFWWNLTSIIDYGMFIADLVLTAVPVLVANPMLFFCSMDCGPGCCRSCSCCNCFGGCCWSVSLSGCLPSFLLW